MPTPAPRVRPLQLRQKLFYRIMNFWPPFLGTGIRMTKVSADFLSIEIELKKRFWNTNVVGVQFGGSIYAMADPFYMLILLQHLGHDYIIWDKAATVHFRKPGKTNLFARFTVTVEILEMLIQEVDKGNGRYDWHTSVDIKDTEGNLIAEVEKVIYLKKKSVGQNTAKT